MKGLETSVQRALAAHFAHLDELLAKTQAACGIARASRLFYRYELDVPRAQLTVVLDGVARFRGQLDAFGSTWGLDLPARHVLASHALAVDLQFLDIALEEMSPRALCGYGALDDEFAHEYASFLETLRAEIETMKGALLHDRESSA